MLGLKLPTDPRWVGVADENIEHILVDHAWCEQKAASTAISLIIGYYDYTDLVDEMMRISQEEIAHFKMVHDKLKEYGFKLGSERKDAYVNELHKFFPKSSSKELRLTHRLLYAALIEARSCERFKMLSENLTDENLSKFYFNLMKSEANHYVTFLSLAKKYNSEELVNELWAGLLEYEAKIIQNLKNDAFIHG